jgi:hypothetical protein
MRSIGARSNAIPFFAVAASAVELKNATNDLSPRLACWDVARVML